MRCSTTAGSASARKDLGSGPLHVLCTGLEPRRFSPGNAVAIVDGTILVDDLPFAGLDTASVWAPPPAPDWTLHSLRMGLMAVDEVWRLLPVEQGLAASGWRTASRAAVSPAYSRGSPGLAAFKRLIEAGLRGQRCAARDHQGDCRTDRPWSRAHAIRRRSDRWRAGDACQSQPPRNARRLVEGLSRASRPQQRDQRRASAQCGVGLCSGSLA